MRIRGYCWDSACLLQDCLGIGVGDRISTRFTGSSGLLHEIITLLGEYGFLALRKLDQNKLDHFDGDLVEVDAFFTKPRSVVRLLIRSGPASQVRFAHRCVAARTPSAVAARGQNIVL